LLVSELVDGAPDVVRQRELLDANRRCGQARLEHPWWRHAVEELPNAVAIENRYEIGNENSALAGLHPHRELVAKIAHRCLAHAGNAQMLAQRRRHLEVELVERDDAVDRFPAREIADGVEDVVAQPQVGHEEALVDAVHRPGGVGELLTRQKEHSRAEALALAEEFLALEVGGEGEDGGASRQVI
jgi:hypothetical protein